MVRLCVPGSALPEGGARPGPWPLEAVRVPLPADGWAPAVLDTASRCKAVVIGPGLGRSEHTLTAVRHVVMESPVPVIADADALVVLGDAERLRKACAGRPLVLTPHDGEFKGLAGAEAGPDRVDASRRLAATSGATVLLKGSLTAVAAGANRRDGEPEVLLSAAGSSRLATAGTGDVLSGIIGAFIARGLDPPRAAALAAHVHGRAAARGPGRGLVAGDLPDLVLAWLAERGAA
jgi:NAD(P)H-hydrate epimerase